MKVVTLRRRRVAWVVATVLILVVAGLVMATSLGRRDLQQEVPMSEESAASVRPEEVSVEEKSDPGYDMYSNPAEEEVEEEELVNEDEEVLEQQEEVDEDEDEDNENGVFRDGDFDTPLVRRSLRRVRAGRGRKNVQQAQPRPVPANRPLENVVDDQDCILWSTDLERLRPRGLTDVQILRYQNRVRGATVKQLTASTWQRCGRPRNQYLSLDDGSHVCARHRSPHHYLILGELLSFYLSRLLDMENVPVVLLSRVDPATPLWSVFQSAGSGSALIDAGWMVNDTVALIQWIDGLDRIKIPSLIAEALRRQHAITSNNILPSSTSSLLELLQWSDLIVFDYITGNYDRMASMQDTEEREGRPGIANDTVHNLGRRGGTGIGNGGLWLLDNESGLLDAYRLMYGTDGGDVADRGSRFLEFHRKMLRTLCLFRRSTVQRVESLFGSPSIAALLLQTVSVNEPLFRLLSDVPVGEDFAKCLQRRVKEVHDWMVHCRRKCSAVKSTHL